MTWLLKGGHVLDPAQRLDEVADVFIEDGVIRAVGQNLSAQGRVLDCSGLYVTPGFIDTGARLGEPGFEHRETIASATRAAAVGGFTALCALPDTDPVPDDAPGLRYIVERARKEGVVGVFPFAALTKGNRNEELTEAGELKEAGAIGLAALHGVEKGVLLRRALQYASMFRLPVVLRSQDKSLADGGVMHEGLNSTVLGLKGIPAAAEEAAVARDIIIARLTGAKLHVMGISTAGAVEQIRRAKEQRVQVSASVSALHLVYTDGDVRSDDSYWKVDPPFRSVSDVEALRQAVRDGTIDVIFSDHRPLSREEKEVEFDRAPFGATALETALPLVLSELVTTGKLPLSRVIEKMSTKPADLFGLPGGSLKVGRPADVTVIDLQAEKTFDPADSYSLSRNTPVGGRRLKGWPVATFVGGRLVMRDGRIVDQ